jgi:hypothetical protein
MCCMKTNTQVNVAGIYKGVGGEGEEGAGPFLPNTGIRFTPPGCALVT